MLSKERSNTQTAATAEASYRAITQSHKERYRLDDVSAASDTLLITRTIPQTGGVFKKD